MNVKYVIKCWFPTLIILLNISFAHAQWTSAGPDGGIIRCSEASGDTVYTITGYYGSSLYVSYNRGATWTNITSPTMPTNVNAILKVGNSLFLGCGSTLYGSVGVFRSDDNGLTWAGKTNIPSAVTHMVSQGTTIFATTGWSGIIRSMDNGETWMNVTSNLPDNYFEGGLVTTPDAVYVSIGEFNRVWRSTNQGGSWQFASNGIDEYATITTMAYIGGSLYAGTDAFGIYKSSDDGNSWVNLDPGTTAAYYTYIAIAGDENTLLAATYRDGILRSTNQGNNWTVNNNGIQVYDQPRSLIGNNGIFYYGSKGGLYITTNYGESWAESDAGIRACMSPFSALVTVDTCMFTAARFGAGIYKSSDHGSSWTNVSQGLPVNTEDLTNSFGGIGNSVFAFDQMTNDMGNSWHYTNSPGIAGAHPFYLPWIEQNGDLFTLNAQQGINGIYRSSDNGQNWSVINNGINSSVTQCLSINTDGKNLLLGTNSGAYFSADNGDTWSFCLFPAGIQHYPLVISSFISTETALYCGFGGYAGISGIYRSTDSGTTWTLVNDIIVTKLVSGTDRLFVTGTFKEQVNGQDVWVPYVYASMDGIQWSSISVEIGTMIDPLSFTAEGSKLFISKTTTPDGGLYFSGDNGESWNDATSGLPLRIYISSLTVFENDLYAGTYGNSLWRTSLNAFDIPEQPGSISGAVNPCVGTVQTYFVSSVPGVNYHWQLPSDWIIISGESTDTITVTVGSMDGIVLVTPYTLAGNGPSQFLAVSPVESIEPEVIIFNDPEVVCEGSLVTFTAQETGGGSTPEFTWYINDVQVSDDPFYSYMPQQGDAVRVSMTSDLPCATVNPVSSNILEMTVIPLPHAPEITQSGDTLKSDYPDGNQWFKDDNAIEGATGQTYVVTEQGIYHVVVTLNNCTSGASNSITTGPSAIGDIYEQGFDVYPVPSNGLIHITSIPTIPVPVTLEVYNHLGTPVYRSTIHVSGESASYNLDLRPLENGLYIIKFKFDKQVVTRKVVIYHN